jgi:type II secretory pathway component GspD/PulD (secretin)
VPDARLNALIVHAKSTDLDTIEQLLKVLDQRTGPETVEAEAQARPIPVYHRTASEIATIVEQAYQDRMAGAAGAMSPQDMMKMLRGGNAAEQQLQKMSIAIDPHNNALVVRAPDALFEEVKSLVAELDQPDDSPETTRVVSLRHTNSAAVQKALASILGSNAQVGGQTTSTTASSSPSRGGDDDDDSPEERARRAARRNMEMLQDLRRFQERMGDDGDRGGFDRSRFFQRGGPEGFRGRGSDSDRGGEADRGRGRD